MKTYTELQKNLRNENLSRVYLLLGPEEFLSRQLISRITELALGDGVRDFNLTDLDTPVTDSSTLLRELNAYPLGASRRVVVVRHVGSLPASSQQALQDYLSDPPDFITLILTADRMDRRKTLYKAIAGAGTVVELRPLKPAEVKAWIRERLRDSGKRISSELVGNIFELTGNDLSDVTNEVDNLLAYLGERETVTREDIDMLVSSRRRDPIYKLTEHVADRNLTGSWTVLRQLQAEGEHELRILWHLDHTVKKLLRAKCLIEDGVSEDAIMKSLQIKSFLRSRFFQQVRSFTMEELRRMYRAVVEWDNKFKSTSRWHPDIDLELLVSELCATREH